MKEELRAITKKRRNLDSAVMRSSLIPSEKYSCAGSPHILSNGSTAMAGRLARRCCWVAIHLSVDVAHEAQALARDGADKLLAVAVVADCLARSVDAAGQGRIGHNAAAPHRRNEIVLCDDAIAVLHNVDQQIEYLRLHCNGLGTTAQLTPVDVKRMIGKDKLHVAAPNRTARPLTLSISKTAKRGRLRVSRL